MKPILLLNNETEIVRLMLEEETSGNMAEHESEARAGCNCDRWGHPCTDVSTPKNQTKSTLQFHQHSNSEVNRWNI